MSDVERYIEKRKTHSPKFAKNFEAGYEAFEFSVMLREARERAGVGACPPFCTFRRVMIRRVKRSPPASEEPSYIELAPTALYNSDLKISYKK